MSATSGQYGKILIGTSNIVECQGWTLNRTAQDHAYATCATTGLGGRKYKKRVAGPGDFTGSMKGLQDPTDPIDDYIREGDFVTLHLYWAPAKYYEAPVMITNLRVEVDIDSGAPVPWEADFGGNGEVIPH